MRNGMIRLRWWQNRRTRFRYYQPHEFNKFLKKFRSLCESRYAPIHTDVWWNGLWHSCHTITDVKENLKHIMKGGF